MNELGWKLLAWLFVYPPAFIHAVEVNIRQSIQLALLCWRVKRNKLRPGDGELIVQAFEREAERLQAKIERREKRAKQRKG